MHGAYWRRVPSGCGVGGSCATRQTSAPQPTARDDDPTHGACGHRGRRPRGREGVLRRARTQAAGRVAGRGRLGGPHRGARVRPGGGRDGGNAGRPRTARAGEVSRPVGPGGDRHAPANTPGIRHIAFAVDDIDAVVARLRARGAELVGEVVRYEDSYRLCYVRGPEGSSSSWWSGSAEGSGRRPESRLTLR